MKSRLIIQKWNIALNHTKEVGFEMIKDRFLMLEEKPVTGAGHIQILATDTLIETRAHSIENRQGQLCIVPIQRSSYD